LPWGPLTRPGANRSGRPPGIGEGRGALEKRVLQGRNLSGSVFPLRASQIFPGPGTP